MMVYEELEAIAATLQKKLCRAGSDRKQLTSAKFILLDVVSSRNPPEFLTTFLNDLHKFAAVHNKADGLQSKL